MNEEVEEDYIDPNHCEHDRSAATHVYGFGRQAVYDWHCKECGHWLERSGWEGDE